MLFLEEYARWLLVLHTALAVALVGASTHLVLWMRPYTKGRFPRKRAVRRFAYITLSLYALTFLGGNLLYPTYKVRVRMEFLENPGAVAREAKERRETGREVREHFLERRGAGAPAERAEAPAVPDRGAAERAGRVATYFDVKEHWVALGLALSAAVALILTFWAPSPERREIAPIVFLMALGASASAWLGAIIGVVTASFRAVGAL